MIASTTTSPATTAPSWRHRWTIDAFAYVLAAISLWPASWLLIEFAGALNVIFVGRPNSGPMSSWRSFCFALFRPPRSALVVVSGGLVLTLLLALSAIGLTRTRSRSGFRLAQAAGRLAKLGLFLALALASALVAMAIERYRP